MTHTLHRRGAGDALERDFVVLSMTAKGVNHEGSGPNIRRFLEIARSYNPVNMGDIKTGNMHATDPDKILEQVQDTSIVHAVFCDREKVSALLSELVEAGLGTSVVVSGLFSEVERCMCDAGLSAHTIEHSLGIRGQKHKLPCDEVLKITTMCGHGMVSASLVAKTVRDIKRGRQNLEQAAVSVAKPCECGVFNPVRARLLLEKLAAVMTFDW